MNANLKALATSTIANGGGTFDARTYRPMTFERGYAVATGSIAIIEGTDGIVEAIERATPTDAYIGTWIDNGRTYIDNVKVIADREEAIAFGRSLNELAIWSFEDNAEIRL